MELIAVLPNEFDWIYVKIEENFIREEIRPYNSAKQVYNNGDAKFFHAVLNGEKIGLVCLWEIDEICFIEYLVVYKEHRNRGFGSKILSAVKFRWKNIVLEAEPPISSIARNRLAFYEKNGFKINSFTYIQPAYRINEEGIELKLLSYPSFIGEPKPIVEKIYKKVYGK